VRLSEQFTVDEERSAVWRFLEQPERLAGCVPGVESIDVLDPDNVHVQITQRIGPMSATFDAKVKVLDRVPEELIRFEAVGRSVRGAAGNIRAVNIVRLAADGNGTTVTVQGSISLAGALGSVGQKVVARQAGKVTADFAQNLQHALSGAADHDHPAGAGPAQRAGSAPAGQGGAGPASTARWPAGAGSHAPAGKRSCTPPAALAAGLVGGLVGGGVAATAVFILIGRRRGTK
jgi:hypothetical protein